LVGRGFGVSVVCGAATSAHTRNSFALNATGGVHVWDHIVGDSSSSSSRHEVKPACKASRSQHNSKTKTLLVPAVLKTGFQKNHTRPPIPDSDYPVDENFNNDWSISEADAVASGESDNWSNPGDSDQESLPGSDVDEFDDEATEAPLEVSLGLPSSEKFDSTLASTRSSYRSNSALKGGRVNPVAYAVANARGTDADENSDESSGAASRGEWDLGNEDSTELDTAVAHFIDWLNDDLASSEPPVDVDEHTTAVSTAAAAVTAATSTTVPHLRKGDAKPKPVSECNVIAQYYLLYPAAAGLFRGTVSEANH